MTSAEYQPDGPRQGPQDSGSRPRALAAACALAALAVSTPAAAGFNAYGTVATEYIYRGLAASAGDPAVQLALDYQHDNGLFAGAWASRIHIDNAPGVSRRAELDLYAGYHYDRPARWSGAVTVMRYTYPGAKGDVDYGHTEWLASVRWLERYSLEVAYTSDLYGTGQPGRHVEVGTSWPLPRGWIVSGSLGRNDLSGLGLDAYLHWDVGASASLSRFTVDVRWYDNEQTYTGGYGGHAAGSRLVLSLSAAF